MRLRGESESIFRQAPLVRGESLDVAIEREVARRARVSWYANSHPRRSTRLELQRWHIEESRRSFWHYRANWVWIEDPNRGTIPYMPFEFHDDAQRLYLGLDGMVTPSGRRHTFGIEASRFVGKTVSIMTAASWLWALSPGAQRQLFISFKAKKVDNGKPTFDATQFGKLRFIIHRLPTWMKHPDWHRLKPRFSDTLMNLYNPANGCTLEGEGRDSTGDRGGRAFRIYVDEANIIPDLQDMLASLYKSGPWCITSTPKGRTTHYARYMHGEYLELVEPGAPGGLVKLRWHYSMVPDYDPKTAAGAALIAEERASMTEEEWAAEMEINYTASVTGRIWAEDWDASYLLDSETYRREYLDLLESARIIDGWDFGDGPALTAWVRVAYWEATDTAVVLAFRQWSGVVSDAKAVVKDIKREERRRGLPGPHLIVGDKAGQQRRQLAAGGHKFGRAPSWLESLREHGVRVTGQTLQVQKAIKRVARRLRDGRLLLAPGLDERNKGSKFPSALEVIQSYSYELRRNKDTAETYEGQDPRPKKDVYSHLADALQHAVNRLPKVKPRKR